MLFTRSWLCRRVCVCVLAIDNTYAGEARSGVSVTIIQLISMPGALRRCAASVHDVQLLEHVLLT